MDRDPESIKCDEHGASPCTYVCEHLLADPLQVWYCNPPAEDDQWPDAWCAKCETEFLKEGEWNDNNSNDVPIKVLCSGCYELLKGRSVDRLKGEAAKAWFAFVAKANDELCEKQDQLDRDFEIRKHERWDWDQEKAELIFSNDGIPAVRCRIAFVGSVSTTSNTWLWSWANYSLVPAVRDPIMAVRTFGYGQDYPKLTIPKWNAEESDGWKMSAIAAKILDAKGIYRTPGDNGFTFLVILDVEWVQ